MEHLLWFLFFIHDWWSPSNISILWIKKVCSYGNKFFSLRVDGRPKWINRYLFTCFCKLVLTFFFFWSYECKILIIAVWITKARLKALCACYNLVKLHMIENMKFKWNNMERFPIYSCRIDKNQLLQLCTTGTAWSDSDQAVQAVHRCNSWWLGPLWSDSVIKLVSVLFVNVLPSWLRNADQWKPDYRVVTNEKPRN